jgi:hypothetical protein
VVSRWVSADPALEKYLPTGDRDNDDNLPGEGGVYTSVNLNLYHYSANNPVNFVDPDGNCWRAALMRLKQLGNNPRVVRALTWISNSRAGQWIARNGGNKAGRWVYQNGNKVWRAINKGAEVVYTKLGLINRGSASKALESAKEIYSKAKNISVIGPRATYRQFAQEIGAHYLKVTDKAWTWAKNQKFLEGIVKRGDDVVFAGKFNPKYLDPKSVLAKEINFLKDHGYKWTKDFVKMIKEK